MGLLTAIRTAFGSVITSRYWRELGRERRLGVGATISIIHLQIVGDQQISRDHLFTLQPSAELAFRSIRDEFDAIIIVVRFTFASIFRQ